MHHISKPQDQARTLKSALKELALDIKHQDALEVIAKVMGHKDWKTMSAMTKENPPEVSETKKVEPIALTGPQGHDIYEAIVTVDMSMSATIRVRAFDEEDAKTRLCLQASQQFPTGFAVDDGNYRGIADYYLGDEDAVQNLSELDIERDCDFYAKATWLDEQYSYEIEASRDEPDNSDDDERAKVSLVFRVTDSEGRVAHVSEDDYEVHGDLGDWIEEAYDEGEFDEQLASVKQTLHRMAEYAKA